MDGVHDMGGMDGFGKVVAEKNEPPFHAPWEGRVLAMQRAMGYAGAWHIDHSRFAQEKLPRLRSVYAWQTQVTPEGAEALQSAARTVQVNIGAPAAPEVAMAKDAEKPTK